MLRIYGIKNCDTMKRAFALLDSVGVDYAFHDYKKDGLSPALAAEMVAGLGADAVVNKRGTTWRKLDARQQARVDTDAAGLLADNPSLVKRPVFLKADVGQWRVGFPKGTEAELAAWIADTTDKT